ncbi:receptor-type guanylate cyclase gcy-19 isoform X2 [Hippoglossus hippoglossus]|uniref:receptor-type guanylate cyclase gcy-19 isoform X2 n=1 Tax=Hippoglossus hippoglossus TaxID=8267 RepID=UPI00148DC597|nr:receptor-type guanylate cyclase gcy-19 isoform X2 [Hippoglossus hippoglossus]
MSSLDLMKEQCFTSGTRSSASLTRRFIKKRRVAPGTQQDADSDRQLCRCSIFPLSGSSRTVRRILTACLLSLLALLGSVSIDLSSHFELLHSTEAAYDELTSCRTIAILQLVSKLQKMRHLFAKHTGNETLEASFSEVLFPVFGHLCGEMAGYSNSYGLSCSVELVGFCQEMKRSIQGFLNTSMYANSTSEKGLSMRICLLAIACLIYPVVMLSFKQMTEWIQNYAQSLKERTEDLKRQRQLAEDLLNQMLPKSVAKQLRQHKHVQAESYEKVTIFFSDIVGFTSISASCTPLQVVEMLNNLYMCFDTRIDSYDVYKVETIGDAYMVVSGLPERNGDRHADEIAKMALDLVAAVRQVSMPHMPNQRLQLRAGIHTGPCVAGIVGSKMPRYCLFGDTVNTASRMESTSLPQRIHTSSETYLALMKDNAYELQLRGEIEVKGKGKMNTYWLIGHKNYSVQNDSLVCHWNPNMARKKKKTVAGSQVSVGTSSVTVQSLSENATTPVSLPTSMLSQTPPQPRTDIPGLSVAAQMERYGGSNGTLGSMIVGLQADESSTRPA